jgi:sugar lactone lactonase YvrE
MSHFVVDRCCSQMPTVSKIIRIDPPYGVPGGEVVIDCADFDTSDPDNCGVLFGETPASIVALGSQRVLAIVPEVTGGHELKVSLQVDALLSEPVAFAIAKRLASDLHPVANPSFDPDDGSLFVTRSGSRGEELPVTLFRIDVNGEVKEYSGDIANPTGIAFNGDGEMFVTSRLDGVVYKVNPFKEAVSFAGNLGVATGIAFDDSGLMYVGDRAGTIFQVNGIGEEKPWAQIEPSVSAFHMAFGPDGDLYVTGPTVTSFDCVWRVNQNAEVSVFFKGLGRPQGLAFDDRGNLYVAASYRGRRGIVRISRDAQSAEIAVAGVNLVGLAFSSNNEMVVASIDSVFSVPMQVCGTLLPRR